MEKVTFHVNLNYENVLSGSLKQVKGSDWFDHIFFFINKNPHATLKTKYLFDEQYLSYIENLNVSSIKTCSKGESSPWWGKCQDLETEKFFNSKIEMSKLGISEGWIPIPTVVSKEEALAELKFPILSREDWGFSGRGVKVLRTIEDLKNIARPSVFSEFVHKSKDYGVTFNLVEDNFFIVENFIDKYGQFKGGQLKSIEESIGQKNFEKLLEIKDKLCFLGAVETIQVDTFLYSEGFHPFVEVNYRKTMGLMVHSLRNYFDEKYIAWAIFKMKSNKSFEEVLRAIESFKERVVLLSPVGQFISVALLSNKKIDIDSTLTDLEKLIGEI